jgi:hypothetical protein
MDTRTERAPSLCPMIALTYSAMLASRGLATLFDTLLHALRLRSVKSTPNAKQDLGGRCPTTVVGQGLVLPACCFSPHSTQPLTTRAGSMSSNAVAPTNHSKYEKDWLAVSRISGNVTQDCIHSEVRWKLGFQL